MEARARRTAYGSVSTSLALRGDRELAELLETATPLGAGIGGTSALLDVEGTPVFVKRVTLTDLELLPGNARSTANLFGVPPHCQYGIGAIGSPGFGAWRELAAHIMTTNWVLAGEHAGFPLLYHWRVLPHPAPGLPEELADVDAAVAYWGGADGVRRRVEALRDASMSLTLFMEHLPHNLDGWLAARIGAGGAEAERACAMVEREVRDVVSFMNARGLLHFDGHFGNLLTDGRRVYVTDFGLATSTRFALSPEERDFLRTHESYDRTYTLTYLIHAVVAALYGAGWDERRALARAWAAGERPEGVPDGLAELLARHSPLTAVMWDFYHAVINESRKTPYPLEEITALGG